MANDAATIARVAYEAYVAKDRPAIEALIADDFHFTNLQRNVMPKFLILYRSTKSAEESMTEATPERAAVWEKWRERACKATVEVGLPLHAVGKITSNGVTDSTDKTVGYSVMQGESKAVIVSLLKAHPQLEQPGAVIDVLEMLEEKA